MSFGTIELPRPMIDAAETYAKRDHTSISAVFAEFLKRQYGFVMSVDRPYTRKKRRIVISPEVEAISGIVSLPDETTDGDLMEAAIMDKYNSLS